MRTSRRRQPTSARASGDPDSKVFRRATREIAASIAVLSAAMVVGGAILLFTAVWISAHKHGLRDPQTGFLLVRLDPVDVVELVVIVTLGVVTLAAVATVFLVSRAVRPLREAMRRQRAFVADASHELRTPLTVMSARTQQLALMAGHGEDLESVIADLHADVAAMTEIVNDMLASITGDHTAESPAEFWHVLMDTVKDLELLASEHDIRLTVESTVEVREAIVTLAPVHLRRVLASVIDNAINHSPPGRGVEIQACTEEGFVTLRVTDHGPGITGIPSDRVFERFAHGDPSPTPSGTGPSYGIGLALVHDVVTSHGGLVEVERTGPLGSVFLLRLPIVGGPRTGLGDETNGC